MNQILLYKFVAVDFKNVSISYFTSNFMQYKMHIVQSKEK